MVARALWTLGITLLLATAARGQAPASGTPAAATAPVSVPATSPQPGMGAFPGFSRPPAFSQGASPAPRQTLPAQQAQPVVPAAPPTAWRNPSAPAGAPAATSPTAPARAPTTPAAPGDIGPIEPLRNITTSPRKPVARVLAGPATLPNDQGQVWREYDISPYTVRVTSTNRPEQAIIDWILRETGYEAWHSEPLGILCANQRTLKVYHTPEMHALISEVVDRFVSTEAESNVFGVRVITVGSPNWRARVHSMLKPVAVQTQGIQAWLVAREDAALMLAEMRKRTDFREHSAPQMAVNNGQSAVVSTLRPQTFIRDVVAKPQAWPSYANEYGQFEEGFSLELSPLLGLDGQTIDAVIKCNIDQLEKLVPVMIDVATPAAPRQRAKIEVPQMAVCRMHERFRWPTDQVLVVGLGVVAIPTPTDTNPIIKNIPVLGAPARADLLVFVENRGKIATGTTPVPQSAARGAAPAYRGRY